MHSLGSQFRRSAIVLFSLLILLYITGAPDRRWGKSIAAAQCPAITITPITLPDGFVGMAYSRNLTAIGGKGPYDYFLFIGALPPGLSLSSTGMISGTPTTAGSYSFTVRARDVNNCIGTKAYTIDVISCPAITFVPPGILTGRIGLAYSWDFHATGGQAPYTYSIISGALPPGLTLSPGTISGTPTTEGSYPFTLRATDANGCRGDRQYTLIVACPTITINPTTLPSGTIGTAYNQTLTATGGVAAYSFVISSGTLPAGLSLASNGNLTGSPTAAGNYNFNVRATDANGCFGLRNYILTIQPTCSVITVNPATLPVGQVGLPYSQTFSAIGGTAPYLFGTNISALPPGLTFNVNGSLSGTPTTAGSYSFIVRGNDSNGCFGERSYTLVVNPACPTITVNPATLPVGQVGLSYSPTLSATGGTAPYVFSIASGALPPGLSLASNGNLSGAPTTAGSYNFRARATDANGCRGDRDYTLVVNNPTCPAITINPAVLSNGTAGSAYSQTVTATGGVAPYGFAISSGVLPTGLTLNTTTGAISGAPSARGAFNFTIRATDAIGCMGERAFNVVIALNLVTSVSAASFAPNAPLATESIVAGFGLNMATSTEPATTLPLPTGLAGASLKVKDVTGTERLAPLFIVSPSQINYQITPGTVVGPAVVTVMNGITVTAEGAVEIATVSPGLFSADGSGQGIAAAYVLRIKASGAQSYEPVALYDAAQNRLVAAPIDLGPTTDQVFLVLFGTGFKFRSALSAVSCSIGGVNSEALYAGEAPGFAGLDQLNARLSRTLAGRGDVDVVITVDGKVANTVRVAIR